MKRFWIDFTVGLFVLIGLIALAFLALRVGNLTQQSGTGFYQVSAAFDNIGSVRVGAPIKSAGIVVGRVQGIALNKNYRGVVHMQMQKEFAFPVDSEVQVVTAGLLGEQYLAIRPGVDSEMLKEGDSIQYTQPAIVLEQLIGQLMLSFTGGDKKKDEIK